MKKRVRMIAILAIIGTMLAGNLTVLAAENSFIEIPQNQIEIIPEKNDASSVLSSASLAACNLGIGIASNGVQVTFITRATQNASEIGVKNVVLQEKTWYGWKDIPISNYCTYNSNIYAGGVVYTLAQKGTTYRVKCTHYAKFGSSELTQNSTSSEIVYN